jgi:hypothetical protein
MRPGSLWSNIRLVHQGSDLHPSKFMSARIGDGLIVHSSIDVSKVTRYLLDGATLIYNHLHESSRAVQRIQETLEYQLGARIWIQAYLTRTSESAFGLHVDDHNFIVLQVAGTKTWLVDFSPTPDDNQPPQPQTLVAGDLVSVPSNTPHQVSGRGELSLHLTIAFDWLDSDTPGSVIPGTELGEHRAAARLGSTLPLALATEIDPRHLPFRFRDRVRPRVTSDTRGVRIECHSGSFLVDQRFAAIASGLGDGRELTLSQMSSLAPQLGNDDLEKFLLFGIENEILSCSG